MIETPLLDVDQVNDWTSGLIVCWSWKSEQGKIKVKSTCAPETWPNSLNSLQAYIYKLVNISVLKITCDLWSQIWSAHAYQLKPIVF